MSTILSCLRQGCQPVRDRTGNGLGQVEEIRVLTLAEILGLEKFGQADDVGAARRGLVDLVDGTLQILVGVGRGGHLYQSDIEFLLRQSCVLLKDK